MQDELRRTLEQAVEQEREHLAKAAEQVDQFVSSCDAYQLKLLATLFQNGVGHEANVATTKAVRSLAPAKIRDSTAGISTLPSRKRVWGVLNVRVEQLVRGMDEITSTGIYDALMRENFVFRTERAVASIAAILRKLKFDGIIKESRTWKPDTRPIVYRKEPNALRKLDLKSSPMGNPPGSLAASVRRIISNTPGSFTVLHVVGKLQEEGYKFDTETPGASVNGVFFRLLKRGQIRVLKKESGRKPITYERTSKWEG